MTPERIYIIACSVLARDIEQAAGQLQLSVGTEFLPGGLHEHPDKLRQRLQTGVDRASRSGKWDRIVIGYGVCGRGTVGIQAQDIPLNLPRVHDCISLFLGGDHLYQEQFRRYPGTYYMTEGWLAGKGDSEEQDRPYAWMGDTRVYLDELVDRYGTRHAEETFAFLNSWRSNYQRAAYIDTGLGETRGKARQRAMKMAEANQWKYQELKGDTRLLTLLLTTEKTTDEILVVPPKHAVVFHPLNKGLACASENMDAVLLQERAEVLDSPAPVDVVPLQSGLGIDAGGTYTDAVVYDFKTETVRCKSKALTTRWDFTVGIREALAGLEEASVKAVQLVSVSTTLATNAIVENDGQRVGLLIMPPPGFREDKEIIHSPQYRLSARLDITGKEIVPLDEQEIRRIARRMLDRMDVEAFAVSGYAGSINPEHELRIKQILQEETGKFVCCGHELSQMLNFKLRAETAVHNARIVPRVIRLLEGLSDVLKARGIDAPIMVVRGDGTLMGQAVAQQRPVETILSGPAASVAGVRFLTKADDGIVVDMGGTTTDIAGLEKGEVRLCSQGAHIGSARTHIKALEIYTTGLGGDSFIDCHNGEWRIGPRRVAPVAWLGSRDNHLEKAFDHLWARKNRFRNSWLPAQLLTLVNRNTQLSLTDIEKRIVELVIERPRSLDEIAQRVDVPHPGALSLERLESQFVIQRCGLTPTDLLHVAGRFIQWDAEASRRMVMLFADISGISESDIVSRLMRLTTEKLTMAIISSQLGTFSQTGTLESCTTCRKLFDTLFGKDKAPFSVRLSFQHPIIGVGAPIGHFLPQVGKVLGSDVIIPENSDVANAIGAITSFVSVERHMTIKPDGSGKFYVQGLVGNRRFDDLNDAERHARRSLLAAVRNMAKMAGTNQTLVTLTTKDLLGKTSLGEEIFLGREIVARVKGRPDLVN
jgi:N-methylhydantoinase A/oxoprolinase/acetone carboxylase beta subunit